MEPFATQPARRAKLHWWIVSGVAAAFLMWQFDLIPRVRSAASGAVAKSKSDEQLSDMEDSFLDHDWSDIRDVSSDDELNFTDSADNAGDSDDPLTHAIAQSKPAGKQQPRRADSRSADQRRRAMHADEDSEIEQASWKPDAEPRTQRQKTVIKC